MYAAGRLTKQRRLARARTARHRSADARRGVGERAEGSSSAARVRSSTRRSESGRLAAAARLQGGRSKYRSFPSGHTRRGVCRGGGGERGDEPVVAAARSTSIGPVMYGGAAAVGLSRMYDNRHWASDVIMGAAIGTFAGTKVVRYHRTHPGNRLDQMAAQRASFAIRPTLGHISLLADSATLLVAPRARRRRHEAGHHRHVGAARRDRGAAARDPAAVRSAHGRRAAAAHHDHRLVGHGSDRAVDDR